ncbi:hypothetical protein GCM10023166_37300 [Paeniglutamicibacter cryotolerans]
MAAVFASTGTTFSPLLEAPVLANALGTAAAAVPAVYVSPMADVDAVTWEGAQLRSNPAAVEDVEGMPGGLSGQNLPQGISNDTGYLPAATALPGGLSFIHPVTSRYITSPYGWRHNPTGPGMQIHIGQDYAQVCGAPVRAAADGVVIQSAWAGHSGQRVTIDHGNGIRTGYSHNSQLIARVGEQVKQGQIISLVGTTGNSTGCHLHLEVIINGRWVDPRNYLPIIPGQPRPLVDSSNTTVAAEPITNTGAPRVQAQETGDQSPYLPAIARPPAASAPAMHKEPKQPAKPTAPTEAPKPKPMPEPTKAPSSPHPDKTPSPPKKPLKPSPTPSKIPPPVSAPKPSMTPSDPTAAPSATQATAPTPAMPTPAPTAAPTAAPTPAMPTGAPTAAPTPSTSAAPPTSSAPTPTMPAPTPSATATPPASSTPSTSAAPPTSSAPAPTAEPSNSPSTPPPGEPEPEVAPAQKSDLPVGSICELEPVVVPTEGKIQAQAQAKEKGDPETGIVSEDGYCLPPAKPGQASQVIETPPARKDS